MSKIPAPARAAFELLRPAFLTGFTFPDWMRILRENRWEIDAKYLPRAAVATLGTIATSFLKPFEPDTKLSEDCERLWKSPLFILGLPRSGTTHLFKLLARDPKFAFPTRLDCYNPHTFLLLRRLGLHRVLGMLPEQKRFMDNVLTGWLTPEEDNIALTILAKSGCRLRKTFPKRRHFYDTYSFPSKLSKDQRSLFLDALSVFSHKLAGFHKKRLLFKSPSHTSAIPEILEVFPEASFVTILRDPFAQFASQCAMRSSASVEWANLQTDSEKNPKVPLKLGAEALQHYIKTRGLVPKGRLVEISYAELTTNEVQTMNKIYSELNLTKPPEGFQESASYSRNKHAPLDEKTKQMVREAYMPFVAEGLFSSSDLE